MSKHSPGPWRYARRYERGPFGFPRDAWVIETGQPGDDDADRVGTVYGEPNARLIAAAPELLEVLKLLLATTYDTAEYDAAADHASAIIASIDSADGAKGET